jgi:small subunit ribosomal protein S16
MPVRIRLQRHGKKGKPFYWIVAADARSKRDGKFLEKLGTYNPNTNPATIDLNIDGSVKWLLNGAQPSETASRILSYKGVLLKHHLLGGVRKGAFSEEEAEKKFAAWLSDKEKSVAKKEEHLSKEQQKAKEEALKAEKEVNEKRAQAVAEAEAAEAKAAEEAAAPAVEEAPAEEAATTEETVAETPAEEAPAADDTKTASEKE